MHLRKTLKNSVAHSKSGMAKLFKDILCLKYILPHISYKLYRGRSGTIGHLHFYYTIKTFYSSFREEYIPFITLFFCKIIY